MQTIVGFPIPYKGGVSHLNARPHPSMGGVRHFNARPQARPHPSRGGVRHGEGDGGDDVDEVWDQDGEENGADVERIWG
jgi:hypothetical protein